MISQDGFVVPQEINLAKILGLQAFGSNWFLFIGRLYGWGVFELPARSPVGMPGANLLLPSLAGLFGIANLLDIYATTSELPPQKEDWTLPPAGPLMVPCFLSSIAGGAMGVLPGMTAAQATVLVMGGRNVAAKIKGEEDLEWIGKLVSYLN